MTQVRLVQQHKGKARTLTVLGLALSLLTGKRNNTLSCHCWTTLHKFATTFLEECVPGLYRIYYNPVLQKGDLKTVLLSNYDF